MNSSYEGYNTNMPPSIPVECDCGYKKDPYAIPLSGHYDWCKWRASEELKGRKKNDKNKKEKW